jgi:hypothetical protein
MSDRLSAEESLLRRLAEALPATKIGCGDWTHVTAYAEQYLLPIVRDAEKAAAAAERARLQDEIQAYQSDPNYDNRYLQGQNDMRTQLETELNDISGKTEK